MILPVASRPSYSLKAPEATSISSAEMPSGSVGRLWPSVLASIDSSTGASTRISAFSGKLTSPGISCTLRRHAGLGQRRGAVFGHALAVRGAGEARGDLRRDVLDVGLRTLAAETACDDALIRHATLSSDGCRPGVTPRSPVGKRRVSCGKVPAVSRAAGSNAEARNSADGASFGTGAMAAATPSRCRSCAARCGPSRARWRR